MIYSKDFAVCPWCGHQTDSAVSHLYDGALPCKAGPWHCDKCDKAYAVLVKAPGDVEITKTTFADNRHTVPGVVLLKRGEGSDAVYFVMKSGRYVTDGDTLEDTIEHLRFRYEEHSCPANWLSECIEVIENGEADPHGFLTFVRCVDVPEDFNEDQADWREIFPEAFGEGPTIDGEVSHPAIEAPKKMIG